MFPFLSGTLGRHALGGLFLAAAALAAGGCGSSDSKPSGRVSGKVTYKGQPVTEGEVNLYAKERGAGALAKIDSSGTFTVPTPVPAGTYAVYVTPPAPEPTPGGPPPRREFPNIPKKYRDAATSGLSVTVKAGEKNDLTIEMTD